MISISSIRGFLIFLGIMILAFATSTNILEQNEFVHERLKNENAPKPWIFDQNFYKKYNTTITLQEDFASLWKSIFNTCITMVKGDFEEKHKEKL